MLVFVVNLTYLLLSFSVDNSLKTLVFFRLQFKENSPFYAAILFLGLLPFIILFFEIKIVFPKSLLLSFFQFQLEQKIVL